MNLKISHVDTSGKHPVNVFIYEGYLNKTIREKIPIPTKEVNLIVAYNDIRVSCFGCRCQNCPLHHKLVEQGNPSGSCITLHNIKSAYPNLAKEYPELFI